MMAMRHVSKVKINVTGKAPLMKKFSGLTKYSRTRGKEGIPSAKTDYMTIRARITKNKNSAAR